MEYIVINYLFDKGETVSEGICFTSQSKLNGLYILTPESTISNIFSKPLGQSEASMGRVGGTKVCSRHLRHVTKIVATPIYGKNPSKSSSLEPVDRFPCLKVIF